MGGYDVCATPYIDTDPWGYRMAVMADEDLDDLLPDDLLPVKKNARPLMRTRKQRERAAALEAEKKAAADLAEQNNRAKEAAARLAQVVNLHIAGYSLADIGASIGATEAEVDRMLTADVARYIRTQPALRTYVRNWISGRFMAMIEADWDAASDPLHKEKLENQDRVNRMLVNLAKLHGAEAPTQSEIKVEAVPESVDRLVERLAAVTGHGYDTTIFDTVPGEVIHQAVVDSQHELEVSGNRVGESDGNDSL